MAEREDKARQEEASAGAQTFPEEVRSVVDVLKKHYPDLTPVMRPDGWLEVNVERERSPEFFRFLRDTRGLEFDYLSDVTAVDYEDEGFQVVYHMISVGPRAERTHRRLCVKISVPRDDARTPSVVDVWPTANFHEREVFDLMGVVFEGHPDLRRILLREDWVGHPLRKDYVDRRPPRPRVVSKTPGR